MRFLIFVLLSGVVSLAANANEGCVNPSKTCVSYYRVRNHIHHFIGAKTRLECAGQSKAIISHRVFGFVEDLDRRVFKRLLSGKTQILASIEPLGGTCDRETVEQTLFYAKQITDDATHVYGNMLIGVSRQALTPVMGRICKQKANDVQNMLAAFGLAPEVSTQLGLDSLLNWY